MDLLGAPRVVVSDVNLGAFLSSRFPLQLVP